MVVLWSLSLSGPALAASASHSGVPATSQATAQLASAQASVPQQASPTPAKAEYKSTRTATPKVAPKGSPFYVQLIVIALLVALGIGYFKVMGHSGRPTPSTKAEKAEKAEKAAAAESQLSDA